MVWKILGTGLAAVAAIAARNAMSGAWRVTTGTPPPDSPEKPEVDWVEAAVWAGLSGAVIGLARLVATRQAVRTYQAVTGKLPKHLRDA